MALKDAMRELASAKDAATWEGVDTPEGFDITLRWDAKDELLLIPMRTLMRFGLHEKFSIDVDKWSAYMEEVGGYMHDFPYHNLTHVTDVTQTLGTFLATEKAMGLLTDMDRLIMLVSAISHDLDHPGTNNLYQVNRKTELSIKYDNKSVLENHHIDLSQSVMTKLGLFDNLGEADLKEFTDKMRELILSTDMAQHFGLCGTLQEVTKTWNATKEGDSLSEEDRMVLMKSLLHLADISNPFKKWTMCKWWSDRVFQEFWEQGDKEKAEELPVSMLCDRDTTKQDESSVNFIDFLVCPFLFACTAAFPELVNHCEILAVNRKEWSDMTVKRLKDTMVAEDEQEKLTEAVTSWEGKTTAFNTKFADLKNSIQ